MPVFWRYLVSNYLKVLVLSVCAFITVLITTRLDDIAHFAALGPEMYLIGKYTLYQIPYMLPIALPISCLISAVILVQNLSKSHELTALRASGMGLSRILAPILITSIYLSLFNFYVVSELATSSHLATNSLKHQLKSINPLLLLHNKHIVQSKGLYFDALGGAKIGEQARKVILAMPNSHSNRLNMLLADNLKTGNSQIIAHKMTLLSTVKSRSNSSFEPVMLENISRTRANIDDFSQVIQKEVWKIKPDHLRLSLLLAQIDELKNESKNKNHLNRSYSEIIRRISVALAVFTFTLMGASFGISISRRKNHKYLIYTIGLAAITLVSYFSAKGLEHKFLTSSMLYLAPHVIIITLSVIILYRISRGQES